MSVNALVAGAFSFVLLFEISTNVKQEVQLSRLT